MTNNLLHFATKSFSNDTIGDGRNIRGRLSIMGPAFTKKKKKIMGPALDCSPGAEPDRSHNRVIGRSGPDKVLHRTHLRCT